MQRPIESRLIVLSSLFNRFADRFAPDGCVRFFKYTAEIALLPDFVVSAIQEATSAQS